MDVSRKDEGQGPTTPPRDGRSEDPLSPWTGVRVFGDLRFPVFNEGSWSTTKVGSYRVQRCRGGRYPRG